MAGLGGSVRLRPLAGPSQRLPDEPAGRQPLRPHVRPFLPELPCAYFRQRPLFRLGGALPRSVDRRRGHCGRTSPAAREPTRGWSIEGSDLFGGLGALISYRHMMGQSYCDSRSTSLCWPPFHRPFRHGLGMGRSGQTALDPSASPRTTAFPRHSSCRSTEKRRSWLRADRRPLRTQCSVASVRFGLTRQRCARAILWAKVATDVEKRFRNQVVPQR